jgi:hypothetical protein
MLGEMKSVSLRMPYDRRRLPLLADPQAAAEGLGVSLPLARKPRQIFGSLEAQAAKEGEMIEQATLPFDGRTYSEAKDHARLKSEYERITELMCDGQWRTLARIRAATGFPEAAISARLRDHRKPKFKSQYNMESRRVRGGCWEYRLTKR